MNIQFLDKVGKNVEHEKVRKGKQIFTIFFDLSHRAEGKTFPTTI